jgi:hypothetical protein
VTCTFGRMSDEPGERSEGRDAKHDQGAQYGFLVFR